MDANGNRGILAHWVFASPASQQSVVDRQLGFTDCYRLVEYRLFTAPKIGFCNRIVHGIPFSAKHFPFLPRTNHHFDLPDLFSDHGF